MQLKPLSLGKNAILEPVVLAPLSGITDLPFRLQVASFKTGYVVSEMIPGYHLVNKGEEARLKMEGGGLDFHVVQLAGCDPYMMSEGVKIAEQAGAHMIDINMGCPSKKVTGGTGGSALMREPDLALKLIEATVNASSLPVTLKMRLGWDYNSLNAAFLAKQAENLGIKLITVHGRTRQQFYEGQANWALVAEVKAAISLPLLVNGDIKNGETAFEALKQSNANGVMVGRAALGKPYLLKQIAAELRGESFVKPSIQEQYTLISKLYTAHITHYGEKMGVKHVRKHLAASLEVAEIEPTQKQAILTAKTAAEVTRLLEEAFL